MRAITRSPAHTENF